MYLIRLVFHTFIPRHRYKLVCLFLVFLISLLFNFAYADDHPEQFSFQGFLKDANGDPVTATKDIILKIYTVLIDGSALWSEEHDNVSVSNGLFNVYVGSQTPFSGSLNFTNTLYLEVIVKNSDGSNAETLSPRLLIAASPFALSASSGSADFNLNQKQIYNISSLNLTQTGSLLAVNITNTGTGNSFRVNDEPSDSTPFLIDELGNLLLGAIAETISDSAFVLDGSNVFFAGLFGVEGDIYTDGSLISAGSVNATAANFTQTTVGSNQIVLDIVNEGIGNAINITSRGGNITPIPFVINGSGYVGIGTSTPSQELNVVGDGLFTGFLNSTSLEVSQTGSSIAANITNTGSGYSLLVNDESSDTTPFVIDEAGNVGIGITDPDNVFHIGSGVGSFHIGGKNNAVANRLIIDNNGNIRHTYGLNDGNAPGITGRFQIINNVGNELEVGNDAGGFFFQRW